MNTILTNIAQLVASAIWADGEYDEAEKIAVNEIADALELDTTEFNAEIEAEINNIKKLDEESIAEYIISAAEGVDAEETEIVFEVILQMIISDNVIGSSEVNTALAIADALGLENDLAILLLLDMVKSEPELEIDFE